MLTLKAVNKKLAELGFAEKLYKGEGYYYFDEGDAPTWYESGVYVYQLNRLTLDQWIAEHARLRKGR